jgi:hypothetical protein
MKNSTLLNASFGIGIFFNLRKLVNSIKIRLESIFIPLWTTDVVYNKPRKLHPYHPNNDPESTPSGRPFRLFPLIFPLGFQNMNPSVNFPEMKKIYFP